MGTGMGDCKKLTAAERVRDILVPKTLGAGFTTYDSSCVKGLAIILMLLHHCFLAPDRYEGQVVDFAPFSEAKLNWICLSFKICVALFVFISGYGIAYSYQRRCGKHLPSAREVSALTSARLVKMLGGYLFVFLVAQLWSLLVVHDDRWLKIYGSGLLGVLHALVDAVGLAELFGTPTFLATFWYMSLATLIVVLVPILLGLARRYGYGTLFALAVLLRVFFEPVAGATFAYLPNYLACVVAGMWAAETNVIGRFRNREMGAFAELSTFVALLVLGAICLYLRQKTRQSSLLPIWDAVIPLLTCCIMCRWIDKLPVLAPVLDLIGRHSMNIFLAHNFVRIMWYYDFTYSFKKWWLIVIVLLVISLVISECIQILKRVTGYDNLVRHLHERCLARA